VLDTSWRGLDHALLQPVAADASGACVPVPVCATLIAGEVVHLRGGVERGVP
jgi:hypothetical protein